VAEVLLFHHAMGQTEGFVTFADDLRQAGHTVHTPDLYGGRVFGSLDEGVAYADEVTIDKLIASGVQSADGFPDDMVYAGFSLGVTSAQKLAQTRQGARGALLFEAFVQPSFFGPWPSDLPTQIHGMDSDPFFAGEGDLEAARALAETTKDVELFVYPGNRHLFADSSLESYGPHAAALLKERILAFLERSDRKQL